MTQIRLKIDTTLSDNAIAGKALKMQKEEGNERNAIKLSLATLFGALAVAKEGGSLKEVQAAIHQSKTQFELYQGLALSLVEIKLSSDSLEEVQNESFSHVSDEEIAREDNELQLDDEEL